jgi:hypothetical protein
MPVIIKKKVATKTLTEAQIKAATNKIRLENMRLLVFEHGSATALATKLGKSLKTLEKYLKATSPAVSNPTAREIEKKLSKPLGWMDRKNYDLALTSDEWLLLDTFRAGSHRDRIILASLANTLGALPDN